MSIFIIYLFKLKYNYLFPKYFLITKNVSYFHQLIESIDSGIDKDSDR
jgi:hypothetical protein